MVIIQYFNSSLLNMRASLSELVALERILNSDFIFKDHIKIFDIYLTLNL